MPKADIVPPQAAEAQTLIDLHRSLIEVDTFGLAQEKDTYSLAQPSPFRFVPSVASNGAGKLIQGE
jgi:hypothetical protein